MKVRLAWRESACGIRQGTFGIFLLWRNHCNVIKSPPLAPALPPLGAQSRMWCPGIICTVLIQNWSGNTALSQSGDATAAGAKPWKSVRMCEGFLQSWIPRKYYTQDAPVRRDIW